MSGSDPPNIVLVVADDIPRNMMPAYGAQHSLSPHIESLARDGVAFDRAYTTAPLCTPSRFGLLTGRFASNASSITAHRPWNAVGFNTFLTGVEPTIAHALRKRGYATGFAGKYHLGFPLPPHLRKGRATFGGGGRGLDYEQLSEAVRKYGGFDQTLAVWGGNKQTERSPHSPGWHKRPPESASQSPPHAQQKALGPKSTPERYRGISLRRACRARLARLQGVWWQPDPWPWAALSSGGHHTPCSLAKRARHARRGEMPRYSLQGLRQPQGVTAARRHTHTQTRTHYMHMHVCIYMCIHMFSSRAVSP